MGRSDMSKWPSILLLIFLATPFLLLYPAWNDLCNMGKQECGQDWLMKIKQQDANILYELACENDGDGYIDRGQHNMLLDGGTGSPGLQCRCTASPIMSTFHQMQRNHTFHSHGIGMGVKGENFLYSPVQCPHPSFTIPQLEIFV